MSKAIKKSSQETALHYRSLGLICRQQAALHPEASWSWLSEAERWEDLAASQQELPQLAEIPPMAA
jgi:hypothetical protein